MIAFRCAGARRSERQIFSVGTPARRGFALVAVGDLLDVLTVVADHPDVRVAGAVLLHVGLRHDVGDLLSVGGALRVANVFEAGEVVLVP